MRVTTGSEARAGIEDVVQLGRVFKYLDGAWARPASWPNVQLVIVLGRPFAGLISTSRSISALLFTSEGADTVTSRDATTDRKSTLNSSH